MCSVIVRALRISPVLAAVADRRVGMIKWLQVQQYWRAFLKLFFLNCEIWFHNSQLLTVFTLWLISGFFFIITTLFEVNEGVSMIIFLGIKQNVSFFSFLVNQAAFFEKKLSGLYNTTFKCLNLIFGGKNLRENSACF